MFLRRICVLRRQLHFRHATANNVFVPSKKEGKRKRKFVPIKELKGAKRQRARIKIAYLFVMRRADQGGGGEGGGGGGRFGSSGAMRA
jgi:hypothetical protein